MDSMRKIGVVLAGGASRRMGVDKLSLPISPGNRTTILEHVVDCVSHVADDVYIAHAPTPSFSQQVILAAFAGHSASESASTSSSSAESASSESHVHFLQDETWYNGPLGVLARLYTSLPKADLVYVVAGDLPGLHSNVLEACGEAMWKNEERKPELSEGWKDGSGAYKARVSGADAALVRRNSTLQPLLGCYRYHALSAFFAAWQAGETRLMPIMAKLKIEPVVPEEAKWPSWWTKPVHTPEDYATWKREWREYHAT
jgi:molybdenum cofactor guanylyltransferase